MPLYSKARAYYKEESVMYLPSFRHLIEIEALKSQNANDFQSIASEHKRISDLESLREKRRQHIASLDEEVKAMKLIEKQLEVESLELKHKRTKEQLEMMANEKDIKSMELQLAVMSAQLTEKETIYFSLLEQSEEIANEKKEAEEFIKGSLNSLEDIKKDVALEEARFQKQIDNRNLRVHSLEEQVEKNLLKFYTEIEKKFAPKRPVAFLIDKKCTQCHMQVDSMFKASLEEGRSIEMCPNCGRLLIPETAKIYA
jgi:predicted  nucleic acid-binding Zn-ribbon protein